MGNDGNTVRMMPQGDETGSADLNGHSYSLMGCNFHIESEHRVASMQYAMEMHCVHKRERDHGLAVVAILFELGPASSWLDLFVDGLPQSPEAVEEQEVVSCHGAIDFDAIMGGPMVRSINPKHYWSYSGSLTTPPCTEDVDWFIMMTPSFISHS